MKRWSLVPVALAVGFATAGAALREASIPARRAPQPEAVKSAFAKLPLSFLAGPEGYTARGPGYGVRVRPTGTDLVLRGAERRRVSLRMELAGATAPRELSPEAPFHGRTHILRGNDPTRWRRGLRNWGKVRAAGVYPGIDAVYYGRQRELEYDFEVAPGADPGRIQLRFPGAEHVGVEPGGALRVEKQGVTVRHRRPVAYQVRETGRTQVAANFSVRPDGSVSFALGAYDPTRPLVIDPVVEYATYLGGADTDYAADVAVDSRGNAYVTGYTNSDDFPTTPGGPFPSDPDGGVDAFVTCFNPEGTDVLFSTYLGGRFEDEGTDIAVNNNEIVVVGATSSDDFPVRNHNQGKAAYPDLFVTRLPLDGSEILTSTYLGGSRTDEPGGVFLTAGGTAYVVGSTPSTNFPVVGGLNRPLAGDLDAFVTCFERNGGIRFSTLLGGVEDEYGTGIAVDAAGRVYVGGSTQSPDYPTTPGAYQPRDPSTGGFGWDLFVSILNSSGSSLVQSTFVGRSGRDEALDLCLSGGKPCLTGWTESRDFATAGAPVPQISGGAFLLALNSEATNLLWSTYLAAAHGSSVAAGPTGDLFVTGSIGATTASRNALLARVKGDGSALAFSRSLGGSDEERGLGIAVSDTGDLYVCGRTRSLDFPATSEAYSRTLAGGEDSDAFLARFSPEIPAAPAGLTTTPVDHSTIRLRWQDRSTSERGFRIERRAPGGQFQLLTEVGADRVEYVDTGLSSETLYTYRVRAYNLEAESGYSNESGATTSRLSNPPAAPDSLQVRIPAGADGETSLRLEWADRSTNETSFEVWRWAPGASQFSRRAVLPANQRTHTDTGLQPSSTYSYQVRAVNEGGASAFAGPAVATTRARVIAPAAPTGLAAVDASQAEIVVRLTWRDGSASETSFQVERRMAGRSAFEAIGGTRADETVYLDTEAEPGTQYEYRVRASNDAGVSPWSNIAQVRTRRLTGGEVQVTPLTLSFRVRRGRTPKPKLVTVRNLSSDEDLEVTIPAAPAPFQVVAGGGAFTLAPGAERQVKVAFRPRRKGRTTRRWVIESSGGSSTVTLKGRK